MGRFKALVNGIMGRDIRLIDAATRDIEEDILREQNINIKYGEQNKRMIKLKLICKGMCN